MIKKRFRDFTVILSAVWVNLLILMLLLVAAAFLLKWFGPNPDTTWPQLFLDAFQIASMERVETGGHFIPVIMAFLLPVFSAVILGEGILRVFSIYQQRRVNRKEWDLMVIKHFKNHMVVCGVGEMGRQLVNRFYDLQPDLEIVLIDLRSGLIAELGLDSDRAIHFQADMMDVEVLEQANIKSAGMVILASGHDALNLEAAYEIQKINPEVPIWIRLHRSGLTEFLDLSSKPNFHFFCPYEQAADNIVKQIVK